MKKNIKNKIVTISLVGTLLLANTPSFQETITNAIQVTKYNSVVSQVLNIDKSTEILKDLSASMDKNPTFEQQRAIYDMSEKEYFLERFTPYFHTYGDNLNGEQINILTTGIRDRYTKRDVLSSSQIDLYNIMLEMLDTQEELGNGIKKAYVTSVIKYHLGYGSILDENKLYWLFEYITDIMPRETTSKYILTKDIDGLINSLKEAYCLEDDTKIIELIELFDKANQDDINHEDYKILRDQIDTLYKELLTNKLEQEPEFKNTLQGQIAQNYIEGKEDYVDLKYDSNEGVTYYLSSNKYDHIYLSRVNNINPSSNLTYTEAITIQANNILYKEFQTKEYTDTLNLLSYLIDWNIIGNISEANSLEIIWQSLSSYFNSQAELAEFIVALDNKNSTAMEEFFSIFVSKIKTSELSYQDIAEYKSLEKYYYDNIYTHVYGIEDSYANADNVLKDSKEAESFDVFIEDYTFGEINPEPYFNEIRQFLSEKDIMFTDTSYKGIYKTRDYLNNNFEYYQPEEIIVYSEEVCVEQKSINDQIYTFYRVPTGYSESECVRLKLNIKNERKKQSVNGIFTTIYNEETDEYELIYLISLDMKEPNTEYEPVVFKTTQSTLEKQLNEKELSNSMNLSLKY